MSHSNQRHSGIFEPHQFSQPQTIDPKVFSSPPPEEQQQQNMYQTQQYMVDTNEPQQQGLKPGEGHFQNDLLYHQQEQPQGLNPSYGLPYGMDNLDAQNANINPELLNHHTPTPPMQHLSPQPDNQQGDWSYIPSQAEFNAYRAPSEYSRSDISGHPSPYIPHQDLSNNPSPLLVPQGMTDLLNNNELDFSSFSLNDRSPHMSPRLSPQPHFSRAPSPYEPLPDFTQANAFGLTYSNDLGQQMQQQQQQQQMEQQLKMEEQQAPIIVNNNRLSVGPAIMVDFAPPQRQPTFPDLKPGAALDDSGLIPPPKTTRGRQRAVSDPYAHKRKQASRPVSPHSPRRSAENSPEPSSRNSLSPSDALPATSKAARRLSAPAMPDRGKLMGLAGFSTQTEKQRVQKHPANYQCNLCTKRFTRAYNLRSHLRTHTDERPFVCTVCGKAFARQHDRKRHEGLHTGEKKYVCAGTLLTGASWGCNRRFARADALGRHFRSEAGRICIRPLLDEEKARNQAEANYNRMHMLGTDPSGMLPPGFVGDPSVNPPYPLHSGLPMAILEQYPILRSMDWDSGGDNIEEGSRSELSDAGWDGDEGGSGFVSREGSQRGSWDGGRGGEINWQ